MTDQTGLSKMTQPQARGLAPRTQEDDDGQHFIKIAIAQPAHPKKPDNLAAGQFFLPLTGEGVGEKLMAICVAQFFTRAYWRKQKEGEPPDPAPICGSDDDLTPRNGESPPQPNGGGIVRECRTCAFGKWRDDPQSKKKRLPPLCSRSINYVAIMRGTDGVDRIGEIGFKKTSYRTGQEIEDVTRSALPARSLWDTVFELSLTEVKKPQQRYFVAKQRVLGLTSANSKDMLKKAEEIFASWSPVKAARVAREAYEADLADGDEEAAVDAAPSDHAAQGGRPPPDDIPF